MAWLRLRMAEEEQSSLLSFVLSVVWFVSADVPKLVVVRYQIA